MENSIRGVFHNQSALGTTDTVILHSLTPLNWLLNAFILALNDSAEAFVGLLSKYRLIVVLNRSGDRVEGLKPDSLTSSCHLASLASP